MRLRIKCIVVVLYFLGLASSIDASTCAQKLRWEGKWLAGAIAGGTLLIPIYGVGITFMAKTISRRILVKKNISQLEAATIIVGGGPQTKLDDAYKVINKLYDELIKMYPTMEMGKQQVVDWLHQLNLSDKEPACTTLCTETLTDAFFPESRINKYLKSLELLRTKEAAKTKKATEATMVRNQKNRAFPTGP